MRAASAAVFAAILIAVLCAGLWLGGHPSHLPSGLSDIFVDQTTTLSGEAAETIEDKYFRPTSRSQLNNGSIAGMIAALRHRHKEDHFSQYLNPSQAQRLNEETELEDAVARWLEAEPEKPTEIETSDWLAYEQNKHQKLLAA